jgi:hypothetical protein
LPAIPRQHLRLLPFDLAQGCLALAVPNVNSRVKGVVVRSKQSQDKLQERDPFAWSIVAVIVGVTAVYLLRWYTS